MKFIFWSDNFRRENIGIWRILRSGRGIWLGSDPNQRIIHHQTVVLLKQKFKIFDLIEKNWNLNKCNWIGEYIQCQPSSSQQISKCCWRWHLAAHAHVASNLEALRHCPALASVRGPNQQTARRAQWLQWMKFTFMMHFVTHIFGLQKNWGFIYCRQYTTFFNRLK